MADATALSQKLAEVAFAHKETPGEYFSSCDQVEAPRMLLKPSVGPNPDPNQCDSCVSRGTTGKYSQSILYSSNIHTTFRYKQLLTPQNMHANSWPPTRNSHLCLTALAASVTQSRILGKDSVSKCMTAGVPTA